MFFQLVSTSPPKGETMPRPVTTTRRITRSNSLPLCETAPLPRESPGPESRLSISLARSRDQADLSALVGFNIKIGRAHFCTPVTTAHLVCRLLLDKDNSSITHTN